MFKKISHLTKVGLYSTTLKSEIKKIKVLNYCAIVGLVNSLIFFFIEIFLQQITLQAFLSYSFQLITIVSAFLLQRNKKYITARCLLLIFGFFILFYNANYAYPGFYGEYMYILLPLISLFFFENKYLYFSVLVICILSFYVPNLYLKIYTDIYFGYLTVVFLFIG